MRWQRRLLSQRERELYNAQSREVGAKVRSVRFAARQLSEAPSRKDLLEVRQIAWERPRLESKIEEEMRTSADLLCERDYDPDIETRVRKISFVKCLMDMLDRMRESAVKSGNSTVVMAVTALNDELGWLLDDAIFMKDEELIIGEFLDLQAMLISCGRLTSVDIPGIEQMFMEHYRDVAATIGGYTAELDMATGRGISQYL